MFVGKAGNHGEQRAQLTKPKNRALEPMHSPVTQDTVVSQGEITPAESRGSGDGSSSKAGNKTEAREPQLKPA